MRQSIMPYKSINKNLRALIENKNTTREEFLEEAKRPKYSYAISNSARWHFDNRHERGYVK